MTEPTQTPAEEPEVTIGAEQAGSTDLSVEPPEKQLQTFDEMLPATRAFYRRS